jgi:hypothetical protein
MLGLHCETATTNKRTLVEGPRAPGSSHFHCVETMTLYGLAAHSVTQQPGGRDYSQPRPTS